MKFASETLIKATEQFIANHPQWESLVYLDPEAVIADSEKMLKRFHMDDDEKEEMNIWSFLKAYTSEVYNVWKVQK